MKNNNLVIILTCFEFSFLEVCWHHRDRSIHIGKAWKLNHPKMTRQGLLHNGFNISLLSLLDVYIINFCSQSDQTNLAYADVKLGLRAWLLQAVHAGSLYVYTTISVADTEQIFVTAGSQNKSWVRFYHLSEYSNPGWLGGKNEHYLGAMPHVFRKGFISNNSEKKYSRMIHFWLTSVPLLKGDLIQYLGSVEDAWLKEPLVF